MFLDYLYYAEEVTFFARQMMLFVACLVFVIDTVKKWRKK